MYINLSKAFSLVFKNPVLTLSLVIYLIFLTMLIPPIFKASSIALIIASFSVFLILSAAFLSGFLSMIKALVNNSYDDSEAKVVPSLKEEFFSNVPVYTMNAFISLIIYVIIFLITMYLLASFGPKLFGSLDFIPMSATSFDPAQIVKALANLTQAQKMTIFKWQISFEFIIALFNYIAIFYFIALVDNDESNIFKAIKDSAKVVFKNFVNFLMIFALILTLSLLLKITAGILAFNKIFFFVFLVLGIYFWNTVFVLIFDYYVYRKRNNCNNGCNSIGQDETSN